MITGGSNKLFSIQYMRAVAALMVVVTHALSYSQLGRDMNVVRLGGAGITLFFVISGCIMVMVAGRESFDQRAFYRRRIERIVPLYWFATLVIAAVAFAVPPLLKETRFGWDDLLYSLLFIPHHRANGEIVPMLKLGWTLNLEMFFYACFGMLASLQAWPRIAVLSFALCILAVIGRLVPFENAVLVSYTSLHLVSFCVGMGLGGIVLFGHLRHEGGTLAWLLAVAGFVLSFVLPGDYPNPLVVLVQAGASALLIYAGLKGELSLVQSRVALLLGDASYSVYLVHMYFVAVAVIMCRYLAPDMSLPLVVLGSFLAGVAGGVASYLAIERPMIRFFAQRRSARLAPSMAAGPA